MIPMWFRGFTVSRTLYPDPWPQDTLEYTNSLVINDEFGFSDEVEQAREMDKELQENS